MFRRKLAGSKSERKSGLETEGDYGKDPTLDAIGLAMQRHRNPTGLAEREREREQDRTLHEWLSMSALANNELAQDDTHEGNK